MTACMSSFVKKFYIIILKSHHLSTANHISPFESKIQQKYFSNKHDKMDLIGCEYHINNISDAFSTMQLWGMGAWRPLQKVCLARFGLVVDRSGSDPTSSLEGSCNRPHGHEETVHGLGCRLHAPKWAPALHIDRPFLHMNLLGVLKGLLCKA